LNSVTSRTTSISSASGVAERNPALKRRCLLPANFTLSPKRARSAGSQNLFSNTLPRSVAPQSSTWLGSRSLPR
jgi:hypothetical protein